MCYLKLQVGNFNSFYFFSLILVSHHLFLFFIMRYNFIVEILISNKTFMQDYKGYVFQ